MRILIESDAAAAAKCCAELISDLVREKPDAVLGLATGGTPVQCYHQLIRMHQEEGLSFRQIRSFNLDEYVGIAPDDENSYRHFMNQQLFQHIDIDIANTSVPNGMTDDLQAAGLEYEAQIADAGGIDLQLLGIGRDGHIAFNEPGSSLASRTRVKTLTDETLRDNARFFASVQEVPTTALTMGVGTILDARHCVLLATGAGKADAIRDAIEGPITSQVTASALQLHPKATFVLDADAAGLLKRRSYYDRAR
ncbi:MAG: glucosamine-6-phosphate deaminase [Planctomycetota bacterium]